MFYALDRLFVSLGSRSRWSILAHGCFGDFGILVGWMGKQGPGVSLTPLKTFKVVLRQFDSQRQAQNMDNSWENEFFADWVGRCSDVDFRKYKSLRKVPLSVVLTDFKFSMLIYNRPRNYEEACSATGCFLKRSDSVALLYAIGVGETEPKLRDLPSGADTRLGSRKSDKWARKNRTLLKPWIGSCSQRGSSG